jgi:hypothetical protein
MIEKEGVWDMVTKTFTWGHRMVASSETVVTKASFPGEAVQDWSIVKTDERGKVIREVVGRSLRRALPALHAA